jgi:putative transposase
MEEIEKKQFDFNDAVQQLLSGKNGILAPLVKQLVEAAL